MIKGKSMLAQRWETLSKKAKFTTLANARVRDLAQSAGFDWYLARGDEYLSDFLDYDGVEIFQIYSLGKKKVNRLCDILEVLLENSVLNTEDLEVPAITKILENLNIWGIPENFPCYLISLPTRIMHYCDANQVTTLGDLLVEWQRLGAAGFRGKRNLGMKSVSELEIFIDGLVKGNVDLVSRFLPLAPAVKGPDFAASLNHIIIRQSNKENEILMLRLKDGLTLEDCAVGKNLCRERVRQLEINFLSKIALRLNFFQNVHDSLLNAWIESKDWFGLARWQGSKEHAYLIKAALETIFRDSPHGVAREISDEMKMAYLEDELASSPDLWFGGTSLEDYLNNLELDDRALFCNQLTLSTRFTLDQATGRVHPAKTDLRHCVMAVILEEDNPLPLTWVVELVKKTGYYPKLERNDLIRARRRWRKIKDFPDHKILWGE